MSSTAFVESTVYQVDSTRMVKKQQMGGLFAGHPAPASPDAWADRGAMGDLLWLVFRDGARAATGVEGRGVASDLERLSRYLRNVQITEPTLESRLSEGIAR